MLVDTGAWYAIADSSDRHHMERLRITEAFAFDAHFFVYRFGPGRQRAFRCFPS
jgi:predicted nucleic acid-binding protein